jgi:chromosomal replication initiator protein
MLICLLFVDKLYTFYSLFNIRPMAQSFWGSFLESKRDLKEKNQIFFSILKDLTPVDITEDKITFHCTSIGAKNYLERKREELTEMISIHLGKKTTLTFLVKDTPVSLENAPLLSFQPSQEDVYRKAGLNNTYTFDKFAVSSTNQVAFAASQAVAQSPGSSYNPLFLYGGVGVGKTHLAQGVAHNILTDNKEARVYFCSGERFMNDLIESIREKTTQRFRKKYRSLELIIVDDIQFIAGKQTVQEEFFHTFNNIVSSGGQVILTSDRPPHEIRNLEDRLRSRFSGGLIVDIQQPDFELRTAILLIKAREKNIELDIEAAKAISEAVLDTRSLEGTLLSLYARSITSKKSIDLEVVEDFFKSKVETLKKKVSPNDVIKTICTFYNIKQSHLKGPVRTEKLALARQVAMFLLRTQLNLNLEEVAYITKRKDHTTVMHAVNKIQSLMMKDSSFKEEVDMITKTVQAST